MSRPPVLSACVLITINAHRFRHESALMILSGDRFRHGSTLSGNSALDSALPPR